MTYSDLWHRLTAVYDQREAQAIARLVFEVRYGLSLSDLLLGRETALPADELEQIACRLEQAEPVQYVLGETRFCGRPLRVDRHVLIPRPETEELCRWIVEERRDEALAVLDIGTGSGCIAITLAADLPRSRVTAWDISEEALAVARDNAGRARVHVLFEQRDVLAAAPPPEPAFDLIVSNPPYICRREAAQMAPNVLDYEPHTALFVPDDDPLLFYRAIGSYAHAALCEGGWLYLELNPLYEALVARHLTDQGFAVDTREDPFGKNRYIRARR